MGNFFTKLSIWRSAIRLLISLIMMIAWTISGIAVEPGNPQIGLSVNQNHFVTGDIFNLHIDIRQGTQNNQVDGWIGVIPPNGSFAFLQSDLMNFSATLAPTVQNFTLTNFSGTLVSLQISEALPAGPYTFLAVGVTPGTDPFEASNHITNVASVQAILRRKGNLVLLWSPSPEDEYVLGYQVFFGFTPDTASQLLSTLYIGSDINELVPFVIYQPDKQLGVGVGDTVCFRVKAFNTVAESDFSDVVCDIL